MGRRIAALWMVVGRRPTARVAPGVGVAALALLATPVLGQSMREVTRLPADCRSVLPPGLRGTVQSWQSFVWLEHCDRIKRLQRLSALLPPEEQPVFYEGIVPASRLPDGFGVDIPVLRVVFPDRTFFNTASANLREEAEQVTAIVASSLRNEPPDVALFVAGHADERGERGYNERLSIDRADAIARRILNNGIAFSSIWRIGFGKDMPLVSGSTPYAWDRNRRVEFLFASKPEAVATWLADQQLDNLCQARDSIEVARCKAKLDFRSGYDALEVTPAPKVRVAPERPAPRQVRPDPALTRRSVAPTTVKPVGMNPTTTALIGVDPNGARKFRIDPRSRRVAPVRVDL